LRQLRIQLRQTRIDRRLVRAPHRGRLWGKIDAERGREHAQSAAA